MLSTYTKKADSHRDNFLIYRSTRAGQLFDPPIYLVDLPDSHRDSCRFTLIYLDLHRFTFDLPRFTPGHFVDLPIYMCRFTDLPRVTLSIYRSTYVDLPIHTGSLCQSTDLPLSIHRFTPGQLVDSPIYLFRFTNSLWVNFVIHPVDSPVFQTYVAL